MGYVAPDRHFDRTDPSDSLRQATADYATLIRALRLGWADADARVPVIGFGGSYGGMLGSWMRRDPLFATQLCTPGNVTCGMALHTVCRKEHSTPHSWIAHGRDEARPTAAWLCTLGMAAQRAALQHCLRTGDTLRGRTSDGWFGLMSCARWASSA